MTGSGIYLHEYKDPAGIHIREGSYQKSTGNEAWEKHYDPIAVGDHGISQALLSTHQKRDHLAHEIITIPKCLLEQATICYYLPDANLGNYRWTTKKKW